MIKKPFVTIGIIARNEEKNITNTLFHLLKQDYPHESIEIIIVDGNSNDKTREVAEEFLSKGNIEYSILNEKEIENKDGGKNYGHSFARNCVIDHLNTKSKYVAWIDADCRADARWLSSLVETMEKSMDSKVIGAGGRRIVETEGNISKKELMLNYYFTSKIMSLGNPAFTESMVEYMPSIAGYNSIYNAKILQQYRYNTLYAFNTDDIEINYRLLLDGYKFLNVPDAKIWHRMDQSILFFLKQMIKYGQGAMNVSKIHKKIVRLYLPIGICYFLYILSLPIGLYLSGFYLGSMLYPLIPLIFACSIAFAVLIENWNKTRSLQSLHVFYITLIHPFLYGYGAIKSLFSK